MGKLKEYSIGVLFYAGLIIICGGWIPLVNGYKYYFTEQCESQTIDHSTLQDIENNIGEKETEFYSLDGETERELKEEGYDGKKNICKQAGKIVSETTIVEPAPNKYDIYTYRYVEPEPEEEYYEEDYYGPSALCRDGTYSYSTGRGTCSWHGGVAQWL